MGGLFIVLSYHWFAGWFPGFGHIELDLFARLHAEKMDPLEKQ